MTNRLAYIKHIAVAIDNTCDLNDDDISRCVFTDIHTNKTFPRNKKRTWCYWPMLEEEYATNNNA